MPECRHSFHGYSRSKEFIGTLKDCFESATCTQKPWTVKYTRTDALSGTLSELVLNHTNKYAEVDNIRFYDAYNNNSNTNTWGQLIVYLHPRDTFIITPGHPDGDTSVAMSTSPYINMYYHGDKLVDSDVLPNYVWYWLWIDDDCFSLRVMGNVGGEGTAKSASEWMYYGPAKPKEDDIYEFPDPGHVLVSEHQLWQERGMMYEMLDKKALGPHYWYNPIGTAITPTHKLETPVTEYALPSLAPVMTSNTSPTGICRASSQSSSYSPYYAFRQGSATTPWISGTTTPSWIEYEFPSITTITEYSVETDSPAGTKSWTLNGSNDGSNYTEISNMADQFIEGDRAIRVQLNAHANYKIYRLVVTPATGNNARILSISFGTHTQPSMLYTAATPLLASTSAAGWNSRVYIGRTALIDSDSIKYAIAQTGFTGAPKYITTGDIVALNDENADYSYHNTSDSYESASGGGTYFYCMIKRMECQNDLIATQGAAGTINL